MSPSAHWQDAVKEPRTEKTPATMQFLGLILGICHPLPCHHRQLSSPQLSVCQAVTLYLPGSEALLFCPPSHPSEQRKNENSRRLSFLCSHPLANLSGIPAMLHTQTKGAGARRKEFVLSLFSLLSRTSVTRAKAL